MTLETLAVAQPTAQPTAEDLYAEGQAAYNRADWTTAVARWQASYQLSGEVGLLFNVAQAQRQSGDCVGALANYRRFVAADPEPTSEQHKLAEDLARELEFKCEEPTSPPTAPSVTRPTRAPPDRPADQGERLKVTDGLGDREDQGDRPGRGLKVAGLVVGGAGVGTFATGLVLGHHASSIGDEVTGACRTTCDWTAWKDKDAAGRRDAAVGRALDVAGVAGIAGGAALYYLGVRQGAVTVSPRSREGGAVISWSMSW